MAFGLSGRDQKEKAAELAHIARDATAASYGVVGFAPGTLYKSLIGTKACNLEKGGVALRLGLQNDVRITLRLVLGYRVSAAAVAMTVRQTLAYVLKKKGFDLKRLDIYIDGIRLS